MKTQNEIKAKEIAQYHCANELNLIQAYNAALEAMEWKQDQLIDKVYDILTKTQPRQVLPLTTIERIIEQLKGE